MKKKLIIMKNEKKIMQKIELGYCPTVLQKKGKSYCNTIIVLQRRRLEENGNCITVGHLGWAGSVLQYTGLYCREEG